MKKIILLLYICLMARYTQAQLPAWTNLGLTSIDAMAKTGDTLILGGIFSNAGPDLSQNVVMMKDDILLPSGPGIVTTGNISRIFVFKGVIYAFLSHAPYVDTFNRATKTWTALNLGLNNQPFKALPFGNSFILVGLFTTPSPYVVIVDPTTYTTTALPCGSPPFPVSQIASDDSSIYMSTSVNIQPSMQRMIISTMTWDTMFYVGLPQNFFCGATAVYNNHLYTCFEDGGEFLYRLESNGTWSALGSISGGISDMDTAQGFLWATGLEGYIGSFHWNTVAKYNGSAWSIIGTLSSGTQYSTSAMTTTSNGDVYAGGQEGVFKLAHATGINNINANYFLNIFPNPVASILTIHLSNQLNDQLLLITDILGNEVYKETIREINTDLDISKWSNGVYFYQLKNDKETLQGKFVVEK